MQNPWLQAMCLVLGGSPLTAPSWRVSANPHQAARLKRLFLQRTSLEESCSHMQLTCCHLRLVHRHQAQESAPGGSHHSHFLEDLCSLVHLALLLLELGQLLGQARPLNLHKYLRSSRPIGESALADPVTRRVWLLLCQVGPSQLHKSQISHVHAPCLADPLTGAVLMLQGPSTVTGNACIMGGLQCRAPCPDCSDSTANSGAGAGGCVTMHVLPCPL